MHNSWCRYNKESTKEVVQHPVTLMERHKACLSHSRKEKSVQWLMLC